MIRPLLLLALMTLAGCARRAPDRPLVVSVIGTPAGIADPDRTLLDAPVAALLGATAQGLVAFDQTGQIEPALAERWIVADGGRTFIFRVRALRWGDGRAADAAGIASRLRAIIAPASRNPLKPLLGAIDTIEAVTPEVIEIDLHSPRPNLLQLLAQPEAALLRGGHGTGPMRATVLPDGAIRLTLLPDPDADPEAPPPALEVRLRGERAALAVARFTAGAADAVIGGSFADLPIARAAAPPPRVLRFDAVRGLFGFAFGAGDGATADPAVRAALAMAIDRDRIGTLLGAPGYVSATAIVPAGTADLAAPAEPGWTALSLDDRRRQAQAMIAVWMQTHGAPPPLRVAMPPGPGARQLFALAAQDWQAIGVTAIAVAPDAPADLVLVDHVAPSDSASFYLRRFACAEHGPCDAIAEAALDAARNAPTLAARADALAAADSAFAAVTPFIALGEPVRWSLVGVAADGWRENQRGLHPLPTLRTARR